MAACLAGLALPDGAHANEAGLPLGATSSTAAAVTALRHLGDSPGAATADWLLDRAVAGGGFEPFADTGSADLLSTATAVHALAGLGAKLSSVAGPCREFALGLWDDAGAFRPGGGEAALDCEYTFYGLLALGHLA
jgi:hypothetical protein